VFLFVGCALDVIDGTKLGTDEGRALIVDGICVGAEVGGMLEFADGTLDEAVVGRELPTDGTSVGIDDGGPLGIVDGTSIIMEHSPQVRGQKSRTFCEAEHALERSTHSWTLPCTMIGPEESTHVHVLQAFEQC